MWFLDLNSSVFMIVVIVFFMIVVVKVASLSENKAQIPTMLVCVFLVFAMVTIICVYGDKEKYPRLTAGKAFTLGELWCNYAEYKDELCKDYVEYVLDNQKKDRQVQFEKAQAKQQKLDDEKVHKNTIKANYENLVKEIVGKDEK